MNGQDHEARENMAAASLMGGLALANAGLGAVHGFASPIGGMFPAPHGAVCARLLPGVFAANVKALQQHPQNSTALERYYRVSRILTGQQDASLEAGEAWLRQLSADLHIRPLSDYGIATRDLSTITAKAMQASSMKANPVELSEGELMVILTEAL